jgi:hypothetical protein
VVPGGQRPGTTSNCGKGRICEARVVEGGVKIIDIIATALTATTPVVTTRRDTRRVRRHRCGLAARAGGTTLSYRVEAPDTPGCVRCTARHSGSCEHATTI